MFSIKFCEATSHLECAFLMPDVATDGTSYIFCVKAARCLRSTQMLKECSM